MMLSDDHLRHLVPMPPPPCGCAPRPWPRPAVPVPITPQMQPHWAEELKKVIDGKQDAISDLDDIREGAQAGATAYQKPEGGVPKADLSEGVQASLDNADTAVQPAAIAGFVDGAGYDAEYGDPPKPTILLKHGSEVVATVDAADFVIDGMVSNVKIENGNLVITFNTDSGKQPISIPLTDIFDPGNYYTKTDVNGLLAGKQDALTFDATPTAGSPNPVTSGGIKNAIDAATPEDYAEVKAQVQTNTGDIADIKAVVPSAATAQNPLVDTQTMNSSIATNTANFLGTYSYVTDLGFPQPSSAADVDNAAIATALGGLTFPQTPTNNDYVFVSVNYAPTTDVDEFRRFKFNGAAGTWAYEYTLNNSSFTAAQWAAINSGITSGLVAKLGALPTAEALAQALAGKQDTLTFDNAPTSGSNNPVKSGGIWSAIWGALSALPTGFTSLYDWCVAQLAGKLDKSGDTMTGSLLVKASNTVKAGFEIVNRNVFLVEYHSDGGRATSVRTLLDEVSSINGKASRAANPTAGNLAALDASGNPTDSAIPAANVATKAEVAVADNKASQAQTAADVANGHAEQALANAAIAQASADDANNKATIALQTIPYSLVTKTIDNGAVTLDDRASNAVTVSATLSPNTLTINFPTADSGKARDFAMRLNIAAGVTAPEIAWPQGVTLENKDGEAPEIADGGTGGSSTILYFSETENNGTTAKFLVKGETLTAIAQA